MGDFHRLAASVVFIAAVTVNPSGGQTAAKSSPEARREDLAKVKESLADPDPLMRLANLEAIINSGDALKTQVALRLAFQSDDADLRALAMRGYIASRKELIFDILLPAAIQRQYEQAQADPDSLKSFLAARHYLQQLVSQVFRVHYLIMKYDASKTTGEIRDPTRGEVSTFFISGDRLAASAINYYFGTCNIDFRPSSGMLKGTLGCDFGGRGSPKLEISAPMF
jgi:hypothetical protein